MPRPVRVLLVDDDADSRGLYADLLGGFEILQAGDGASAIKTALAKKPDVIVMDLEMPVMGGLQAVERLKGDARTRAIPIVILSGNGASDLARAERAGCVVCLVKPCSAKKLEEVLRGLVDVPMAAPESA